MEPPPAAPPDDQPAPATRRAARRPALVGGRLLALAYDLLPATGLWFLVAAAFVAVHGDAVTGGALGALECLALWLVTGAYAVASWHRGGQTLGMRPWSLRVEAADGGRPALRALAVRYAVGTVSLLPGGLGFWWGWRDPGGLAWHDRASATRLVRTPRRAGRGRP